MLTKINFHGINISNFTEEELWCDIDSTIRTRKQMVIYWRSLGTPYLMKKTPGLLKITNNFDILLIDGRGLFLFMKMMGRQLKNEIYTSWFTLELLKKAAIDNYSVMILGATEETNQAATYNLINEYKVKTVHQGLNGYFTPEEEVKIVEQINKFAPDILLVGISTPKKELFAHNHRHHLNVRIIHLCGGMVDVIAGKTKITPKWIKKLGFAWLYRIMQEPKRLLIPVISMVWEGVKFSLKIIFTKK